MKNMILLLALVLTFTSCKSAPKEDSAPAKEKQVETVTQKKVKEITSVEHFQQVISQKDRLFIFDLYADWCGPCKMLAPILEEVAESHGKQADFYKIDTEKLPQLARAFKVQGIPHVAFFKDGGVVNAYTGLYPKEAYEQSVEILAHDLPQEAQGELVEGNRQITVPGDLASGNIVAYRGDVVELTFSATGKPFTVELPDFTQKGESDGESDVKLTFKVKELGFFAVNITDGNERSDRLWMGVIQYGQGEQSYKEVDAKGFKEATEKENTFILDVRTKGEYDDGHIKGATLIPVQELDRRLAELDSVKDKTILIYCRSGNRSTVAANILKNAGFKSLVNLRPGIKAWKKAGYPTEG